MKIELVLKRRDGRADAVAIYENGNVKSQASIGFDHNEMIIRGVERLRSKITYSPIGFHFVGNKFTLNQIQMVHETI